VGFIEINRQEFGAGLDALEVFQQTPGARDMPSSEESMSRGLEPILVARFNVRAEARTYLTSKDKNKTMTRATASPHSF